MIINHFVDNSSQNYLIKNFLSSEDIPSCIKASQTDPIGSEVIELIKQDTAAGTSVYRNHIIRTFHRPTVTLMFRSSISERIIKLIMEIQAPLETHRTAFFSSRFEDSADQFVEAVSIGYRQITKTNRRLRTYVNTIAEFIERNMINHIL